MFRSCVFALASVLAFAASASAGGYYHYNNHYYSHSYAQPQQSHGYHGGGYGYGYGRYPAMGYQTTYLVPVLYRVPIFITPAPAAQCAEPQCPCPTPTGN